MIYAAHVIKDAEGFCFVSLDDEHYIGVNRFPEVGAAEEDIQELLDGAPDYKTKPMMMARRFIQDMSDDVRFFEIEA